MNALCYKIVFSKRLGTLVAVGEHTAGQGKAAGTGVRTAVFPNSSAASADNFVGLLKAVFASIALRFVTVGVATAAGPAANTLPTGYSVNSGNVAISSSATANNATMVIKQNTDKASINWQSFSIGSGAAVNVQQNSASSVLLNRVVGNDPSQIFGKLTANGQVILINPNGVVFGKGGSVTASAFTASTFGMTDADFSAGKHKFTRNGSTAGVTVEDGATISTTAPSGYVALMGASVDNQGAITTQGGAVVLASGETVALPAGLTDNISVPLSGKVRLELQPSTLNAMVANSGTITTEGGQVLMQAAAVSDAVASIAHTGTIDTTGEQGGAVTLHADHGDIKVSGVVKANSKSTKNKGGNIIIGRDEVTGVLAKTTDVSNAKLESNKGFVETSGDYLVTDGVAIKAAQWLLDPSDVTISNGNNAGYTNVSGTYTPDASAATSVVKVDTIQGAINNGTSVTITTTNTGASGSGAGNITIADKLTFTNTGATDATLSLIADNGITQNAGAAITTTTASTKLVNIKMEAKGNYQGSTVESNNSKGITLNSTITTNGTVTLTGTSKDTTGVQTVTPYNYGVTNNSRSGVVFNHGSGITADNYQVTGTHTVAGNSFGVNGVYMNGAVTFKATGNTNSNITGNSNAQGNFGAGVMVWDGASVRLENQGAGITTLKGSNTNTVGGNGIRIGASTNTASIDAIGRVTLGQQAAGTNAPIFIRSTINASQNNVGQSGLRIVGQTEKNTSAVQIWDTNINAKGVDVVVDGITANATGVYIQNSNYTTWDVKNLTVTGVANTIAGSSGSGVVVQRFPNVLTVTASGNIDIQGTVEGGGNGRGLYFAESGWGAQAPILTADGNITLRGNNRSTNNSLEALNIVSGLQAKAGGNIVLQGETNKPGTNAIQISSRVGALNGVLTPLAGNTSLDATGNILIQANQGGIVMNNNPLVTTPTTIVGKNIIIDNTGAGMITGASNTVGSGGIDGTTGVISAGSGKATGTGINLADTRAITASGNLNIMGASSGAGAGVSSNAVLTADGAVNLTGQSVTGQGIFSAGAVKSNNASVSMIGRSTDAAGGAGVVTQGTVSAQTDIKLEGYSANTTNVQGLVVQNAVTSNAGDITVKGETKASNPGQRAVAITTNGTLSNGGLKVADGKTINIHANTLYIAPTASVNAGTGTVNIQTLTSGNEILIGGTTANDGMGSGLTSQKLGIDNTELNRITAGKLVIGDTSSTGKITVSAATTTLANTGHVTLQTSGNIEVNAGLKVGDDGTGTATKNLTLNGAGASSSITQTAAIKAASLELLGTNATHTLTNTDNHVTTLAGNSKAINYVNGSALTLGAVNAITGVNATGDLSIATQTGNLTVAENVSTTATTATALVLNAGKSTVVGAAVGADVGGNIVVSTGKTVSVGSGGTAQLMTGSITGDTSAAGLAAAGNFRYNSDESNTNYNTALSRGVNVIYREKPTLTVNVNNVSKTYDGLTFTGGNGFTEVTPSGLKNGDGLTGATATAVYGGTAQNAKNASSTPYTLSASESIAGKTALGYGVTYNSGTLTVAKKDVNLDSITAAGKTYDGNNTASITAVTLKSTDLVGSETLTASAVGTFDSKNAGSRTATVTAAGTTLTDGANGGLASNYNVVGTKTVAAIIAKKDVTYSGVSVDTKIYDGTTAASLNGTPTLATVASSNSVATDTKVITGDRVTLTAATGTFASKNVLGTDGNGANTVTLSGASLVGNDAANYNLVQQAPLVANNLITPKSLTALYVANSKVFDGNTNATLASATLKDIVAGDVVTPTNTSASFDTAAVGTNKTVTVAGIQLNGADAANYKVASTTTTTNKPSITAVPVPPPTPVVPTNTGNRVKIPVGSSNPFALASAEDLADDTCTANSIENCYCEESTSNQGVDICYEPKTGAKGSVR
jgi:filamentous hemagglutinin family protein